MKRSSKLKVLLWDILHDYRRCLRFSKSMQGVEPSEIISVNCRGGHQIRSAVFLPKLSEPKSRKAMVLYYGGGWRCRRPEQFFKHAEFFSNLGYVVFCPSYRTFYTHGVRPIDCINDAIDFYIWLENSFDRYNIDADKLVYGGGSVGGHMATLPLLPANRDKLAFKPAALLLFNPVTDTTESGYGFDRLGDLAGNLSIDRFIDSKFPPTIIFHGINDAIVNVQNSIDFAERLEAFDCNCELHLYEDMSHGFFNYYASNPSAYNDTVLKCKRFLDSLSLDDSTRFEEAYVSSSF